MEGLTTITSALETIPTYMESVWNVMVSNPYTVTFLAVGFVFLGIRVFRAIKRAASR